MIENTPKISALVITYNQEDVIARAIDSLLSQKDYIYEICVSDDCSTDKTYEILCNYSKQYPSLFKLNRNKENVGYFVNLETVWKMPTGDMVYILAGDDECGDNKLEKVVNYINNNNLDFKNDYFCIYGDYMAYYPNGDTFVLRNKLITTNHDPMGLALRRLINNRSSCFSKKVIDCFIDVSQGRSYAVESAQDRQVQIFSKKNYYIPHVGNIYYTGIGVSTGKNRNGLKIEPSTPAECLQRVLDHANYKLNKKDENLMKFFQARAVYNKKKLLNEISDNFFANLVEKIKLFSLLLKSTDISLGIKGFNIKRYLFAIVRRLPHKEPIHWTVV